MPRFVIQMHQRQDQPTHWDLMLEKDDVLKTFRMPMAPESIAGQAAEVILIKDHPLRFLTYQGPVNQGQGQVRIVEAGTYKTIDYATDYWTIELHGGCIKGKFRLKHDHGETWHLSNLR